MKKCLKEDCNSPVFSNGYCKIHHYLRSDDKYKKSYKPKRVYEKKKYHKRYPVDEKYMIIDTLPLGIVDPKKCMYLKPILEDSAYDLQQDDIIYQKEKIVSPTAPKSIKRTPLKKTRKKSNHVEIYMDFFGYCKDDVIVCERCNSKAVDVHHIHGRGKDKNVIENLIALCRECHTLCHSNKDINRHAEVVHLNNVLKELKNRKDKI